MDFSGIKFRVGTADYHVIEVDDILRKHDLFGQVTYDDAQIALEPTLCDQRKVNVIIHELLHAIFYEAGFEEQDEDTINRVANVLTQVLRDNSFELLFGEESEI